MSMDAKCDHARFCRVDRKYQSEQSRITLSVDRSGVRDAVVSALQQLGAARKYGRAPSDPAVSRTPTVAGHPARQEGRRTGLITARQSEVGMNDGAKRGSAAEYALFPSIPVTLAFSVRQSSSDAVTRGLESLRISSMGDGLMTAKGSTTSILFGHKCILVRW